MNEQLKALPDLSLFPESHLVNHAMSDPVSFGQTHREDISRYVDIAGLATSGFSEAEDGIRKALGSSDPMDRLWACMVCSSFGKEASSLASEVTDCMDDENGLVRLRAIEFLGLLGERDPIPPLLELVNTSKDAIFVTEVLNSMVYFVDCHEPPYQLDASLLQPVARGADIERRVPYLKGESTHTRPKKKTKKAK